MCLIVCLGQAGCMRLGQKLRQCNLNISAEPVDTDNYKPRTGKYFSY
jgi:hypothetical protein